LPPKNLPELRFGALPSIRQSNLIAVLYVPLVWQLAALAEVIDVRS